MLKPVAGRCWPLLGLLALLFLSASDLIRYDRVSGMQAQLAEQLQPALANLLAQGHNRGYQALLKQHQSAGSLRFEVFDRGGQSVAVWPVPFTASEWGMFAQPLQEAYRACLSVVAKAERMRLMHEGYVVGEMEVYQPRGWLLLTRQSGLHLATLVLALMALWSLLRMGATPFSAPAQIQSQSGGGRKPKVDALFETLGSPLEQLGFGLIRVNSEACVASMNTAAQSLTGWQAQEANGLPLTSVVKIEADSNWINGDSTPTLGRYSEQGFSRPFSLRQRDESLIPVVITQIPLRREKEPDGLLLILADVRAQKSELDELRSEASLAAKTLDYMSDGLAITNRYGRITRCNKKMQELFSYPGQTLEGLTVSKLMPVPFLNDANVSLKSYLPQRRAGSPAVVGWRQDASTFAVDLRVEELFDDEQAYLLLIRDRAARQQEENLAQRFAAILAATPCGLLILEPENGYCNAVNPQAVVDLGYAEDQLRRMSLSHLIEDLDARSLQQKVTLLKSGSEVHCDMAVQVQRADGESRQANLRLAWSGDEEPAVLLAFLSLS
ncbi:MAG: PAS domain S-box protein [Oceanococcus sp.]